MSFSNLEPGRGDRKVVINEECVVGEYEQAFFGEHALPSLEEVNQCVPEGVKVLQLLDWGSSSSVFRGTECFASGGFTRRCIVSAMRKEDDHRLYFTRAEIASVLLRGLDGFLVPNYCEESDVFLTLSSAVSRSESLVSFITRMEGRNLFPFSLRVSASLGLQLFILLSKLEKIGIVHGDIKPGNILVQLVGETRRRMKLWLLDWDLMTVEGEYILLPGEVCGSPFTMAPEQAVGGRVSAATDRYAVGAVLYLLFSGQRVFSELEEEGFEAVLAAHKEAQPDMRCLKERGVPRPLVRLVEGLLHRDPLERWPCSKAKRALLSYLRRF
jgi:serine/threonine protein kinase